MSDNFQIEDYDFGQYDIDQQPVQPPTIQSHGNSGWQSNGQQPNSGWEQPNITSFGQPHQNVNTNRNVRPRIGREPRFNRDNFSFNGYGHQLDPTTEPNELQPLKHAGSRIPFKLKCYPLAMYLPKAGEEEKIKLMECSNKIIAPMSVLQKICQYNVQPEHIYQINKKKNRVSIEIYYEYSDMNQMNDAIYVPIYIFEGLGIDYGDTVDLDFVNEVIPKGNYVKMQPVTNQIQEVNDYETYMTGHLERNYTCLCKGDTIKFAYYDDVIEMIIHDLQPANIVSITNTDLSVDFEPSVEQREKEIQNEIEKAKFLEEEKKRQVKNDNLVSFGKNMHKLNYNEINSEENYKNGNQEFTKDNGNVNIETPNEFVPFQGTGHSLSGKTPPLQPKMDTQNINKDNGNVNIETPNEFVPFQGTGHSLSGKTPPLQPKMDTQNINKANVSLRFNHQQSNLNGDAIPITNETKPNESFQGKANKLNTMSQNVSMKEARLRRLAYLEKNMKSKPSVDVNKREQTVPMEIEDEISKIIEEDKDVIVKKEASKKKKKHKFILKKGSTISKPYFLL